MSKYIYSTLANDNAYTVYVKGPDLPSVARTILVKGGVGVADKRFDTPRGVVTTVTDEEAEVLQENPIFQRHMKNGFITIDDAKADPEKVAADMESRDPGGPLVPGDFEDDAKDERDGKARPTGGSGKKHR